MSNDDVRAFIARMQADLSTTCAYLPRSGPELDDALLATDWSQTARVLREGGAVVGCAFCEHDPETHRTWVLGPWVATDQPDRATTGVALVLAMAQQVAGDDPSSTLEMLAPPENRLIAEIAGRLGWPEPYSDTEFGTVDYRSAVTS